MAHESFEDDDVAALLNEHFVCIKVDREERPDIDAAYMAAIHATGGRGGWPLTAVLDLEKRPWFLGTYFPKTTRGRMGMMELLPKLAHAWAHQRDEVHQNAAHTIGHAREAKTAGAPSTQWWARGRRELAQRFDETHGGFGGAPKFPSPHQLQFLLHDPATQAMACQTLDHLLRGGIHDHVGGGFHRYSTDAGWRLPHFEKMLYDQATLMMAFTDAWKATKEPRYAAAVEDIFQYLLRDMRHPQGAFFSAEDADSEGEEGTFYVWKPGDVRSVLGDQADPFMAAFGFEDGGNFADESTGKRSGDNVLHAQDLDALNSHGPALLALRQARDARVRPQLDDKILVDWNGMIISALARAGAALGRPDLVAAAEAAAAFIRDECTRDGLRHRWHDGRLDDHGFLDDHAWFGTAALDLHEATGNPAWLAVAVETTNQLMDKFTDGSGAFRLRSRTGEAMVIERIDAYDGAAPSGNSIAIGLLEKLGRITEDSRFEDAARDALDALAGDVERMPSAYTALLNNAWPLVGDGVEVVVTGAGPDADSLEQTARASLLDGGLVLRLKPDSTPVAPWLAAYDRDVVAAYVCRGRVCDAPVTTSGALAAALQG